MVKLRIISQAGGKKNKQKTLKPPPSSLIAHPNKKEKKHIIHNTFDPSKRKKRVLLLIHVNPGKVKHPSPIITHHFSPTSLQKINAHLGGFGIPAMHTVSQPARVDVNVKNDATNVGISWKILRFHCYWEGWYIPKAIWPKVLSFFSISLNTTPHQNKNWFEAGTTFCQGTSCSVQISKNLSKECSSHVSPTHLSQVSSLLQGNHPKYYQTEKHMRPQTCRHQQSSPKNLKQTKHEKIIG